MKYGLLIFFVFIFHEQLLQGQSIHQTDSIVKHRCLNMTITKMKEDGTGNKSRRLGDFYLVLSKISFSNTPVVLTNGSMVVG
jgi:hypothetical protein